MSSNLIKLTPSVMGYVSSFTNQKFEEWWLSVKDKIDWRDSSKLLADYVPQFFDIWYGTSDWFF